METTISAIKTQVRDMEDQICRLRDTMAVATLTDLHSAATPASMIELTKKFNIAEEALIALRQVLHMLQA